MREYESLARPTIHGTSLASFIGFRVGQTNGVQSYDEVISYSRHGSRKYEICNPKYVIYVDDQCRRIGSARLGLAQFSSARRCGWHRGDTHRGLERLLVGPGKPQIVISAVEQLQVAGDSTCSRLRPTIGIGCNGGIWR